VADDIEYSDTGNRIVPNNFTHDKCGNPIDLPRKDGLCEYWEYRSRIDLDICNVIIFVVRKYEGRGRQRAGILYDRVVEYSNLRYILGLFLLIIMISIKTLDVVRVYRK
jgi:hypothetical protein